MKSEWYFVSIQIREINNKNIQQQNQCLFLYFKVQEFSEIMKKITEDPDLTQKQRRTL
jgi:L-rhamnose mutarotase